MKNLNESIGRKHLYERPTTRSCDLLHLSFSELTIIC